MAADWRYRTQATELIGIPHDAQNTTHNAP